MCNASLEVATDCQEGRGAVFDPTASSTWEQGDQYALGLDEGLGESGVGQYGALLRLPLDRRKYQD